MCDIQAVSIDSHVEVVDPFRTDDESEFGLIMGDRGVINQIEDGWWLVDFDRDTKLLHWVSADHVKKLRVPGMQADIVTFPFGEQSQLGVFWKESDQEYWTESDEEAAVCEACEGTGKIALLGCDIACTECACSAEEGTETVELRDLRRWLDGKGCSFGDLLELRDEEDDGSTCCGESTASSEASSSFSYESVVHALDVCAEKAHSFGDPSFDEYSLEDLTFDELPPLCDEVEEERGTD